MARTRKTAFDRYVAERKAASKEFAEAFKQAATEVRQAVEPVPPVPKAPR